MSRLDETLKEHERKIRDELVNAHKRRADLVKQMLDLDQKIQETELDLIEVTTEVTRREIIFQKAKTFVIAEGYYD